MIRVRSLIHYQRTMSSYLGIHQSIRLDLPNQALHPIGIKTNADLLHQLLSLSRGISPYSYVPVVFTPRSMTIQTSSKVHHNVIHSRTTLLLLCITFISPPKVSAASR